MLDRVPVSKVPLFSIKVRVPVLAYSPGSPGSSVNTMGPPDKVNEVALARAPLPFKAIPLSGPVIVIIGLPLFPEKVMLPVVGADNVTVEFDALTVIELNVTARVKRAKMIMTFRISEAPRVELQRTGWCAQKPLPATNGCNFTAHKTVVNGTAVPGPDSARRRLSVGQSAGFSVTLTSTCPWRDTVSQETSTG